MCLTWNVILILTFFSNFFLNFFPSRGGFWSLKFNCQRSVALQCIWRIFLHVPHPTVLRLGMGKYSHDARHYRTDLKESVVGQKKVTPSGYWGGTLQCKKLLPGLHMWYMCSTLTMSQKSFYMYFTRANALMF